MNVGNITRRGKNSWRLKFETGGRDPITGKRRTRFVTVRGTKNHAKAELVRLLAEIDNGTAVDPSKSTVGEYIRTWLDGADHLAPKTAERYRELADNQIIPYLGSVLLQKLRPAAVAQWHTTLLRTGSKAGGPLTARTVGHAHRVLHAALAKAASLEIVSRNVAAVVPPPKVDSEPVEILTEGQIGDVLSKLDGHDLRPIVTVALGTGLRRGELCGLQWRHVDLDRATLRVDQSLEETGAGLRVKPPKSKHGRRSVTLPATVSDVLRSVKVEQAKLRLALGLGRQSPDDFVFSRVDGSPLSPDQLSKQWRRLADSLGLPRVMFHAFRHSHASALIAAGLDVVTVSRRLGHGSPSITLSIYAHLFSNTDAAAAKAMDAALGKR